MRRKKPRSRKAPRKKTIPGKTVRYGKSKKASQPDHARETGPSFEFSDPALEFIQEASARLSIRADRLKTAIAATRMESGAFRVIEAVVEASRDETKQKRLESAGSAIVTALETITSSDEDPLAGVDGGISHRRIFSEYILAEREAEQFRKQLLAECVSVDEAARITGRTRQALERRRRDGKLLAVKVKNQWRYPRWQFDPTSPGGVVAGLPDVLAHLDLSPLGTAAWLTESMDAFDDRTAIEMLWNGKTEEVIELAEEYGHGP